MTHFHCIPTRIQMLTFQHWKKRKPKTLSPLDSKRQALYLCKTPSKAKQTHSFAWPLHSEIKRRKILAYVNSDVHWKTLNCKVLATADLYLDRKQKRCQCLNSAVSDNHFGKQQKRPCIRHPRLPTKLCLVANCFLFLHFPLEINDHLHILWTMKGD